MEESVVETARKGAVVYWRKGAVYDEKPRLFFGLVGVIYGLGGTFSLEVTSTGHCEGSECLVRNQSRSFKME